MCEATMNVSTFINLSSAGAGGDVSRKVSSATTSEPMLSSRVVPGEVHTVKTPTPAPSVTTGTTKKMTMAEIRRMRQHSTAPSIVSTQPDTGESRG